MMGGIADTGAATTGAVRHTGEPVLGRTLVLFAVVVTGLFALLFFLRLSDAYFHFDDAFITYTFARNLAAGHGIVFHPALMPIQGSSTFLYTLLLALLTAVLPVPTHLIGAGLSVLAFPALLLGLVALAAQANPGLSGTGKMLVFGFGVSFQQPLLLSYGMETIAVNALLVWTVVALIAGRRMPSMLMLAAIPLARLDYLFYWPCLFVAAWLVCGRLRRTIALFLPGVVTAGLYLLFARLYFGHSVPHPWLAKLYFPPEVSGVVSWQQYLHRYPSFRVIVLLSAAALALALIGERGIFTSVSELRRRPVLPVLAGLFLSSFAYLLILEREDAPNMAWYYVTPIVFIFGLLVVSLNHGRIRRSVLYPAAVVAAVLCNLINSVNISSSFIQSRCNLQGHHDRREAVGIFLRDQLPGVSEMTALCYEVGKIPYFSGVRAYDSLGLVSDEGLDGLAAGDTAITLNKLDPDLVIGGDYPRYFPMRFLSDPSFMARYRKIRQIDDYGIWVKRER